MHYGMPYAVERPNVDFFIAAHAQRGGPAFANVKNLRLAARKNKTRFLLVHIPKFRIGAGKVLANASTSLLGLLRANIRIFPAPRI
jgi:hypothetical protein